MVEGGRQSANEKIGWRSSDQQSAWLPLWGGIRSRGHSWGQLITNPDTRIGHTGGEQSQSQNHHQTVQTMLQGLQRTLAPISGCRNLLQH